MLTKQYRRKAVSMRIASLNTDSTVPNVLLETRFGGFSHLRQASSHPRAPAYSVRAAERVDGLG